MNFTSSKFSVQFHIDLLAAEGYLLRRCFANILWRKKFVHFVEVAKKKIMHRSSAAAIACALALIFYSLRFSKQD